MSGLFLILPSCSDNLQESEDLFTSTEEYGYIALNILLADNTNLTRAVFDSPSENTSGGSYFFNTGLDQEKAVVNDPDAHWVLAFDNSQNIIASIPLDHLQEISMPGSDGTAYKGVCKVPLENQFLASLDNMRVILNANEDLQNELKSGNLTNLQQISTDKLFFIDTDGTAYHTMSTAMTIRNNQLFPASQIVKENGQIKTYPKLTQALENPSVTLYLERLQSKFTILFNNGSVKYFDSGEIWENSGSSSSKINGSTLFFNPSSDNKLKLVNSYNGENDSEITDKSWKINISGWGINAAEETEFLFKNLGQRPSDYNDWNYPRTGQSIRNLWSVDPNYSKTYKTAYPDQYRDAYDKIFYTNGNNFQSYEENVNTHTLRYFSFTELSNRNIREYSGENTYSATQTFLDLADPLGDLVHLRCGSHLIVCAQLLIEGMDDTDVYNSSSVNENGLISINGKKVIDKFFTNNQYWSRKAYIDYFRLVLGNNMNVTTKCISDRSQDFVPNDQFNPVETNPKFYVSRNGQFFEASDEDFEIVSAQIVGGDGWCFPFPKNSNELNTSLYVKTGNNNSNNDYTVITVEQYLNFVYGYTSYFAKHFNEGRMYYALPIMHDPGRSDEGNFGRRTGDLGVVRNNWYNFTIGGLVAPGISVNSPDQPIIPNNEPSAKGLGFEVMIIPWHLVLEEVDI